MEETMVGIDIGGTLAKVCFVHKNNPLSIKDEEKLRSKIDY